MNDEVPRGTLPEFVAGARLRRIPPEVLQRYWDDVVSKTVERVVPYEDWRRRSKAGVDRQVIS